MKRMQGISVVEVALALTIATLLFAVAAPAMRSAYLSAQYESVRMALAESVLLSNRVAAASGGVALLCPSDGHGRCREDADWSGGWLAYVDMDQDRRYGSYDVLLQRQPPLAEGLRLTSTDGRRRLAFQPDGGSAGSNLTFSLCSRSSQRIELIVLSNSGRFRTARGSDEQPRACLQG